MPREIVKTVYTAEELKAKFPAGFERALADYREFSGRDDGDRIGEDILESIKGLFAAAGVKLRDYRLSAYGGGSYIKAEFSGRYDGYDDPGELKGSRALAWIENNILGPKRITPTAAREYLKKGYGKYYRAGEVKPAPFTGICYDDGIMAEILADVKDRGCTLRESFEGLGDYYARTLSAELEYQAEPAQFLGTSAANGWEYDENGEMV